MMLLASSAMGRTLDPETLVSQVRDDMANLPVFKMILRRFGIGEDVLNSKLAATTFEMRSAIMDKLNEWSRLDTDESMGRNALPSIATLKRLGLISPDDENAAWGYLCLRTDMNVTEFVLREPERAASAAEGDVQTLASNLVTASESSAQPVADDALYEIIYRIVKSTGWRRCLVVADGGGVKVSEIPVATLLSDIYGGSLEGLVLAGVNAPDTF
ncbi:MAG: hypothetical protein CFE29_22795 [Bradyrhizobiaceae bacterium PARB1]|nr:MAG: hypothetical protein CFE29_22795 [Bradyrhizobiaceae bacterium PARB1]